MKEKNEKSFVYNRMFIFYFCFVVFSTYASLNQSKSVESLCYNIQLYIFYIIAA